jgi:predicted metalloprotease with PDZ domain
MNYEIEYYQPHNQYIKINATFNVSELNQTILTFPTWRPGRYQLADFSKNINHWKCLDDNGKIIESKKISKNEWEIDTSGINSVTVNYFFYANELNGGSTFMDDTQLYVNPINCLVYIKEQQINPCVLKLVIPDNFEIASGIPFIKNQLNLSSYHELVDCPFIASASLQHDTYKINNIIFHLWVQGEAKIDWKKVKIDFIKFTRFQLKNFGHFPVDQYHFLFQILPIRAYHGVEHQNSTVIALGPSYELMNKLYDDLLGVSSHELYHTWNVKAIRPAEMLPYDYSKENYSTLGYVTEGVTTYMGDLYLSASNVKSWEWYKAELEKLFQKHFDNFARFNYSVAQSSWDTWLDGYAQGVPNRKVSIYNEGAILAFITDIIIRDNTRNKASLHNVMTELYNKFGKTNIGYTDNDYVNIVSDIAQKDMKTFFKKYYFQPNSIEPILTDALFKCGLEVNSCHNPHFTQRILGMKTLNENGNTIVKQIFPSSPSELGKVSINDIVLSINGYKVNGDLSAWVEYFQDDQIELTVSRMGRVINLICPHTNRNYYKIYKINKVDIPSKVQKGIFRKWCGHKLVE